MDYSRLILSHLVVQHCQAAGIESVVISPGSRNAPLAMDFTAYKGQFSPNDSPVTADICRRQLTLPLFPTMTEDEVDQVCNALLDALA